MIDTTAATLARVIRSAVRVGGEIAGRTCDEAAAALSVALASATEDRAYPLTALPEAVRDGYFLAALAGAPMAAQHRDDHSRMESIAHSQAADKAGDLSRGLEAAVRLALTGSPAHTYEAPRLSAAQQRLAALAPRVTAAVRAYYARSVA